MVLSDRRAPSVVTDEVPHQGQSGLWCPLPGV